MSLTPLESVIAMKNQQYTPRLRGLSALLLLALVATPALAQPVHPDSLEMRDGRYYAPGSATPYTGALEDPGRMVGQVEDGLRVGTWKGWYPDGQLNWAFEHDAGQLVKRTIWHANGAKRMEGRYVAGKPDGVHPRWDAGGQKVSEETYREGALHGPRRVWDADGHLLQEAQYKDGQLDGPATWYYASGAKRWETHYAAGQRTGTWTQWTAKGELFMQTEWADGKLVKRHNPHRDH